MIVLVASYQHYLMGDLDSCTTVIVGVYSFKELAEEALEEALEWVREGDLVYSWIREYTLDALT